MRVITGWIVLSALTAAGLLYTDSQVRLVDASYALNERLERRDALHEQYTYLAYDVMALTAPNRLKERLISINVELTTPQATEIIAPDPAAGEHTTRSRSLRWWRTVEAEARTE